MKNYKNVDAYIQSFPPKVQKELRAIRATIRKAAPKAKEKIAYGIPTFFLDKNLVHFAAFKTHFGFFPASRAIVAFRKELAPYSTSRGTIRFPFGAGVPHALVRKIVRFNVKAAALRQARAKAGKRK